MDRRDFIKTTLAAMGLMMVPTTFVQATTINNVQDLIKEMESLFKCRVGPAGPYVTQEANEDLLWKDLNSSTVLKYITCMFCLEEDDPVVAEKRLSEYFYSRFKHFAQDRPELIWRVKPEFDRKEIYEFDKVFMTNEDFEDARDYRNLYVPENVAYDFETDTYRFYKNKFWLNRIRSRLAIPEVPSIHYFGLPEGVKAERI